MNDSNDKSSRMTTFSPLRYPGGKGRLAAFAKNAVKINGIEDGSYIEPYAGGAAIAIELLLQEYVSTVYINDISRPIWAFWNSVLNETELLLKLIKETPISLPVWNKQKAILKDAKNAGILELGFATFFLNRTNRSGILSGGAIGGKHQSGQWKLDARFNKLELIRRITEIARKQSRIHLSCLDAKQFLLEGFSKWDHKTLIYLDPPYYNKGSRLYLSFYKHSDHAEIASLLSRSGSNHKWMISYDGVDEIRSMYSNYMHLDYSLLYSAQKAKSGMEVMFFADNMAIPPLSSSMKLYQR